MSNSNRGSIEGNQAITSLLLNTDTSIAGVINLARQRAEDLCRNKWKSDRGNAKVLPVICYNGESIGGVKPTVEIYKNEYAGKTVVIKGANIELKEYMLKHDTATTIFVDK